MTKSRFKKNTKIVISTFIKMSNNGQMYLNILTRTCLKLNCKFDNVVLNRGLIELKYIKYNDLQK